MVLKMSAVDLVLYYSEEAERHGRKLQEVLNNDLPDMRLELFTDFEELVTGLQRPEVDPAAVVLVIGSRTELDEFLPLRPILQNTGLSWCFRISQGYSETWPNNSTHTTSNLPGMTCETGVHR